MDAKTFDYITFRHVLALDLYVVHIIYGFMIARIHTLEPSGNNKVPNECMYPSDHKALQYIYIYIYKLMKVRHWDRQHHVQPKPLPEYCRAHWH